MAATVIAPAVLTMGLAAAGGSPKLAVIATAALPIAVPLTAVVADNNGYLSETGCILHYVCRSLAGTTSANWVSYYLALTAAAGLSCAALGVSRSRDRRHQT